MFLDQDHPGKCLVISLMTFPFGVNFLWSMQNYILAPLSKGMFVLPLSVWRVNESNCFWFIFFKALLEPIFQTKKEGWRLIWRVIRSDVWGQGLVKKYMCVCVCACVHACMCMCMWVCTCVHMCAHVCMCMCVCYEKSLAHSVLITAHFLIQIKGNQEPCNETGS